VTQRASPAPVDSLQQLADVIDHNPRAPQVIAAASKLHRQIRHLMDRAPNDPKQVSRIAELLRIEQSLLLTSQPPGVDVVLSATRKLAARLVGVVPHKVAPTDVPRI